MEINGNVNVKIGDWVKGRTRNGELIHGYVENIQSDNAKVEVRIVISDNEEIIGKGVRLARKQIEKLEQNIPTSETQLKSLIDLALQTSDQEWFVDLTEKLNKTKNNSTTQNNMGKQPNQNTNYYGIRE
ncbi:IDEAL domain-containing protein [Salinibacillus kushneri]|uniref:IDEAL domain-containing protein n=1 Tax=Salinibacillus kushneri TaxID=237682 RepID=A0A1I0JCA2_9BACI|nr:IDEAL domain-containing protein [Salinibacillus kushneri]SEU07647.1 IDEAL domain-containing protein [Salinibacillus kushneri]